MGWFVNASIYPVEGIDLDDFLNRVRGEFPQKLLNEDNNYPSSRKGLYVKKVDDYGCVYCPWPKSIPGSQEDFRSWIGNLGNDFKVAYLVQGDNTGGNGEIKVYVPKGHPLQMVEHRLGVIGPEDGKNRLYAFKRFERYQTPDKSRDHLDELEAHYGGRPYYFWR